MVSIGLAMAGWLGAPEQPWRSGPTLTKRKTNERSRRSLRKEMSSSRTHWWSPRRTRRGDVTAAYRNKSSSGSSRDDGPARYREKSVTPISSEILRGESALPHQIDSALPAETASQSCLRLACKWFVP